MQLRKSMSMIVVCLFAALAISVPTSAQTISTFDVPGAGTGVFQGNGEGTFPIGINVYGAITGYYIDSNFVFHGFLRAPDGSTTTFDAPGAGTGSFYGTLARGLNQEGAITGFDADPTGIYSGLSCALPTALSPCSTLRARARAFPGHCGLEYQ